MLHCLLHHVNAVYAQQSSGLLQYYAAEQDMTANKLLHPPAGG
jgi:hypothetical protein